MATQDDWLAKFAAKAAAVQRVAAERPRPAGSVAAAERQRTERAGRTRQSGQGDLFAQQADLFARKLAARAAEVAAPAPRTPPPVPERSRAMGAASAARFRKVAEATAKEKSLTGSHRMTTGRGMQTAAEFADAFYANAPKIESRGDRNARQRASFAAYRAQTTDTQPLSESAYASELNSAARRVAAASTPAPKTPAPAPAPKAAPAKPRRVDRQWAGGDRDSDDIYRTEG